MAIIISDYYNSKNGKGRIELLLLGVGGEARILQLLLNYF